MRAIQVALVASLFGCAVPVASVPAQTAPGETVRDRLWIWGHPAGVYNASFLAPWPRKSSIEPVPAAQWLGVPNMIFVHYDGKPEPPFDDYYLPFRKLDRVYWSLVGASGVTSAEEREHVYRLAEANGNLTGFILDDFFHVPVIPDRPTPGAPWLAENRVQFPVTVTLAAPAPVTCDALELVQSDWPSGDYRSKDFEVEISLDGHHFSLAQRGTIPNEPAGQIRLNLPSHPLRALRIRILSTHDTAAALSCGLNAVRLYHAGQRLDLTPWTASASSSYPGFDPESLLGVVRPFPASLTPGQLAELGERTVRGRKLPIMAVVYTGQIAPQAKWHLDQVDEVCLWTWRPGDLKDLEANLTALETLVSGKPIYLGCYMYDFDARRALPIELMKQQTESGFEWLKAGRIQGIIFLATPNVDVGLEAVEWTRQWIAQFGGEPLKKRSNPFNAQP
jgi:hypothetical protein